MATVRPFRGLRPRPEAAAEVASPPYDVLSAQEARMIALNNPNSFLRVNKAELEFDESTDPYGEEVYRRGKENLNRLHTEGMMLREEKPAFYLYRLTMNGKSQTGLATLTSVEEYNQGLIKKHEHTRPEKVSDRANHISFLEAQVGPVFSTFKHNDQIDSQFKKIMGSSPTTDFVADDGIRHEFWVIDRDDAIKEIIDAFAAMKELYIADGHHRSAAAAEICRRQRASNPDHTGEEPYNFFLNVLFADRELNILPYNRVITELNNMSLDQVLEKAAEKFEITPVEGEITPDTIHHFGLYAEGKWYKLVARPDSFDSASVTGSIDTSVLADNLISPILGIDNPKTDKRIDFIGGIRGTKELVKLVDSKKFRIAFSLYPTSIQQLLDVADAGEVMPPKSTWFEPKLRSGMVVNMLTE
ncbi:MAG: DUF1015 domain-containing protein [FCB group bacterium]|nr:DUF1015 domain-containing protein [FCB group bacterium]